MPGDAAYAEVRIAGVGGGRYYTPPGLPGIELLNASGNRQMAIWQEAGRVSVINDDGLDIDFRFEGANNANLIHMDAGQDAISLGGANVDGAALILNNLTDRTAVTVVGNQLHIPSQTQNFDNSSGTVAVGMTSFFGTPTLTNDNATLTFTTYATVKINSGPTASTNVTISTALALWVAAGTARFDGITLLNDTLDVTVATLAAGDIGVNVGVTVATPNNALGMSGYFDVTITGATAGHSYGFGSWINGGSAATFTAGHIIVPFEGGVYSGVAQASARIVFAGQHMAILAGAPSTLHAWRLNVAAAAGSVTAVIAAANPGSVGYVASGTTSSSKIGDVPMFDIVGAGVVWIRIYDAAG